MFYCQVNENDYVFQQGDDANSFFITGKYIIYYLLYINSKKVVNWKFILKQNS